MSSIPIKMDSIIKHYFDRYRIQGKLPPIIQSQIKGKLAVDMPKTLKIEDKNGIILWGRPDDYFRINNEYIVAFDHKTKSKKPEDIHSAYQLQLNVYSYLLQKLGYKTINKAFLAFYYPDECDLHNGMPFKCTIIEVETNHKEVETLLKKAYNILNGPVPKANKDCEYCKWIDQIQKEDLR